MKNLLFLSFLFPAFACLAQGDLGNITDAIRQGNAAALSSFFDQQVELSTLDKDDRYPKTKATDIMRNFFAQYPPDSFRTVHKGTSSDNQYCIGNLTAGGQTYRVYIYLKNAAGRQVIQELRFDRE